MGKYLVLWELDQARLPVSRKERGAGWAALMKFVHEDIEKGFIKEFGAFVGETRGFGILEGDDIELDILIQKYVPFVIYEFHPIVSAEQLDKLTEAMK